MDIRELLHNAKPGDEFLTRGGSSHWFVGRTRNGKYVFESQDGETAVVRNENGTFQSAGAWSFDIVGVPPKTHTRFFPVLPCNGYATFEEASQCCRDTARTVAKITWTEGEHQQ